MGYEGATCSYNLSRRQRDLKKEEWDRERFGMLCTTSTGFSLLISALQKLCYKNKQCSYEEAILLDQTQKIADELNRRIQP